MLLLVVVSILHYLTPVHLTVLHDVFKRLYYIPVILVAIRSGWKAGLLGGAAASVFYLPHILFQWGGHPAHQLDQLMEIPMLLGAGVLSGMLVDRDRAFRAELARLKQAAAIGRATASIIGAMKAPMVTISGLAIALGRGSGASGWTRSAGELIAMEAAKLEGIRTKMISFAQTSKARPQPLKPMDATLQLLREASHLLLARGVRICIDSAPTSDLFAPRETVQEALSSALAALVLDDAENCRIIVSLRQRRYGVEWLFTQDGTDPTVWQSCDAVSQAPIVDLLLAERVALTLGGKLNIGYEDGRLCAVLFGLPSRVRIPGMTVGRMIKCGPESLWKRLKPQVAA